MVFVAAINIVINNQASHHTYKLCIIPVTIRFFNSCMAAPL